MPLEELWQKGRLGETQVDRIGAVLADVVARSEVRRAAAS